MRELLQRVDEREAVGFHLELDDVAVGTAAETVVKTFAFVDGKRRGLFVMKRTEPLIFAPFFGQLDLGADTSAMETRARSSSIKRCKSSLAIVCPCYCCRRQRRQKPLTVGGSRCFPEAAEEKNSGSAALAGDGGEEKAPTAGRPCRRRRRRIPRRTFAGRGLFSRAGS